MLFDSTTLDSYDEAIILVQVFCQFQLREDIYAANCSVAFLIVERVSSK